MAGARYVLQDQLKVHGFNCGPDAHTWHGGTQNVSGERRRVLHLSYCHRSMSQQLVQQDHLTPFPYERMNEAHRYLLDIEA